MDRNNLAKQTEMEFTQFRRTENGKALSDLYRINRLKRKEDINGDVVISTIQKLFTILTGSTLPDESDDDKEDEILSSTEDNQYNVTIVFAQKCNLKTGGINTALAKYLDETTLSKYPETEFLTSGDIVINSTGTGTLGRVCMIEEMRIPIVPDTHITVIRTSPNISSQYIYCVLKESQSILEDSGEGSTNQKELRPNTLMSFLVPLPPLTEQIRIAAIVTEVNNTLLNIAERLS